MKRVLTLIGLLGCSVSVMAVDTSLSYSMQPLFNTYNDDSDLHAASNVIHQPDYMSRQILEMSLADTKLSLTTTAKHTVTEGKGSETDLIVKELVYSDTMADWDFSAGRKISSWGVGLAYRPLDVVQREDLLSSEEETLQGVNQLAMERYSDDSSIGFFWINPGEKKERTGVEQPALITRYTKTGESADWQSLLRYSDEHKAQVGVGISYIASDALELHVSALYSSRYHRRVNALAGQRPAILANADPWRKIEYRNGVNWMIGGNYSWSERHNIIVEYWHDDLALSHSQWQDHLDLMSRQNGLLNSAAPQNAVEANLAWSAQALGNEHLIQDNVFLRYQYQGDSIIPRASVLYSPADGGYRLSTQVMLDKYPIKYNAGVYWYQDDDETVYGQVPYTAQVYFTIYGNL